MKPEFFSLKEIFHSIKSFSANEINKVEKKTTGRPVWENESFDRLMRSDADVEEKFLYICRNPWTENIVRADQNYAWIWTWSETAGRQDAAQNEQDARAPQSKSERALLMISGEFAFRLYDEQGFPLDLTQLMARERGLTVDVAGFREIDGRTAFARARGAEEIDDRNS